MGCSCSYAAAKSGGAKYVLNGLRDAVVAGKLELQLLSAIGREAVEADLAVGLGDAPVGGDPALEQQLLERGIEEAFFNGEDFTGEDVDFLGYGVAVKSAGVEDAEEEHGESAGRHSGFRCIDHRHKFVMPWWFCQALRIRSADSLGWLMAKPEARTPKLSSKAIFEKCRFDGGLLDRVVWMPLGFVAENAVWIFPVLAGGTGSTSEECDEAIWNADDCGGDDIGGVWVGRGRAGGAEGAVPGHEFAG